MSTEKRIAIVGCGALGTILGAYLTKHGCDVEMIDNYKAHVDAMNEKGASVVGTANFTVPVKAKLPEEMTGIYDIVFLLTKQTANDIVLTNLLPHLDENSVVCTLQNGAPEPFVAQYVGDKRTVGGATIWSATFEEPGVSRLTQDLSNTEYLFEIGEIDGQITPRIKEIAAILELMGRPTKITDSLMASRWGKLVNNACVSGMSAVCGATFGEVLDHPISRACVSYIGREVKRCANAEGYTLAPIAGKFPLDSLELTDKAMFEENQAMFVTMYSIVKGGKASMLQDLEKGLVTEVRMINGYVSDTGKKHNIPTPFNDMVVEIVSRIEAGEIPYSMDNLKYFDRAWFDLGPEE
ncbi:MAG: ketopantoate reductase family protein [Oscillospiraceae bacterium]|nr:ketopantoate reductase family protein [Oscillospiraceae bacterium]